MLDAKGRGKLPHAKNTKGKQLKDGWNDATRKLQQVLEKLERDTEAGLNDLRRHVQSVQDEAGRVQVVAQSTKRAR